MRAPALKNQEVKWGDMADPGDPFQQDKVEVVVGSSGWGSTA